MNNWTKQFNDLEVGKYFEAERGNYTTLNGTRQRLKLKEPDKTFSITQSGNITNGKVTVKRTS